MGSNFFIKNIQILLGLDLIVRKAYEKDKILICQKEPIHQLNLKT